MRQGQTIRWKGKVDRVLICEDCGMPYLVSQGCRICRDIAKNDLDALWQAAEKRRRPRYVAARGRRRA